MSLYDFGIGGYDLLFSIANIAEGQSVNVHSKIGITQVDSATPETASSTVVIGKSGSYYEFYLKDKFNNTIEKYRSALPNLGRVRLVWHNEFCTIYVDDFWIHTFACQKVYVPEDPVVEMSASISMDITDVRLKELSDWREAIFIDLETTSINALQSVVLQRPVNIYPEYSGALVFEYSKVRDSVSPLRVYRHKTNRLDSPQACSDAITYFTWTAVITDKTFARKYGFVTRVYRFPDIDNGAITAARMQQDRSRQQMVHHELDCRVDPRISIGDRVVMDYDASGTGSHRHAEFIVESVDLTYNDGEQGMKLTGRDCLG
jgi:hypothetical protein